MTNPPAVSRLGRPPHATERAVALIDAAIADGIYQAGSRLPSTRDLSATFKVSRKTVMNALEILAERGAIDRRPGKGAIVNTKQHTVITRSAEDVTRETEGWRGISAAIRDSGGHPFKVITAAGEIPATQEVAQRLHLEPGTLVFHRARLHGATEDDRRVPIQLSWSYYTMSVIDRIPEIRTPAERGEIEIRSRIVAAYGAVRYGHKTTARHATSGECDRLGLPDMAVVLDSWRLCTEEPSTIPLEVTHMVMDARKIVLTY